MSLRVTKKRQNERLSHKDAPKLCITVTSGGGTCKFLLGGGEILYKVHY